MIELVKIAILIGAIAVIVRELRKVNTGSKM